MIRQKIGYKPVLGTYRKPQSIVAKVTVVDPHYEQSLIDKAVADLEKGEKEKKLLDVVLKQPESDEKALILKKKYRIGPTDSSVDAYIEKTPERISGGIVYRYDCYLPQDTGIDTKLRPTDFTRVLGPFTDTKLPADVYYFYFPISRAIDELVTIYKIDHANVYIYPDGSIDTSRSVSNSLYGFLFDLQAAGGDYAKVRAKYLPLLTSLKIESSKLLVNKKQTVGSTSSKVTVSKEVADDYAITFAIKGLGIRVKSKIIKANVNPDDKKSDEDDVAVKEKNDAKLKMTLLERILVKDEEVDDDQANKDAEKLEEVVRAKLNLPLGTEITFLSIEKKPKDQLLIPVFQSVAKKSCKIAIINKSIQGMSVGTLRKAVLEYNDAVVNRLRHVVNGSFKKKLEQLNATIPDANNKFKMIL